MADGIRRRESRAAVALNTEILRLEKDLDKLRADFVQVKDAL
ncbi:hypothetical protein HNR46_003943 [Haloferula luteola]|uniref:Uncharacterized protein n=1 Tax=Haloferula luteola TaxID=595692 RepID=A0A840V6T3_9BACT|nr:hypothetical protein [Haloferula luteola]MBB5353682.1 hypothetical protein [Haloferula luteola]